MPDGGKLVTRQSRWGNRAGDWRTVGNAEAVRMFRAWLTGTPEGRALLEDGRRELKGRPLGCYCAPGKPCHADVWLELVNESGGTL